MNENPKSQLEELFDNSDDSGVDNEKSPSGQYKETSQMDNSFKNSAKDANIAPFVDNYYSQPVVKSPTSEDDYIRSKKVHSYHGRQTHYYRDEPKHNLLLSIKVLQFGSVCYADILNKIRCRGFICAFIKIRENAQRNVGVYVAMCFVEGY